MTEVNIPIRNLDKKYYRVSREFYNKLSSLGYSLHARRFGPKNLSDILKVGGVFLVDESSKSATHTSASSLSWVSHKRSSIYKGKFAEEITSDLINYYYTNLEERHLLSTEQIKTVLRLVDKVMHDIDTDINLHHFSYKVLLDKMFELKMDKIIFRTSESEREERDRYEREVFLPLEHMFKIIGFDGFKLIVDEVEV